MKSHYDNEQIVEEAKYHAVEVFKKKYKEDCDKNKPKLHSTMYKKVYSDTLKFEDIKKDAGSRTARVLKGMS